MENITTTIVLKTLSAISRLSWKTLYRLSGIFRFVAFNIVGYRKKVILNNLKNSFPEKPISEINHIASRFYKNVTDIVFESVKMNSITKNEILDRFELDSYLFDKYYEQKKNLVVVLGHFGNWEMANIFASVRLSHQVVVVYHKLANDAFEDWIYKLRTRFGSEMVPMHEAYHVATLPHEKPFMFLLVNDQSPNPFKAYWTRFLNQDTGVFRGVERISRTLNAPVLYGAIFRNSERGHYKIQVEEITAFPQEEPLNAILEKQVELLERDIRLQPDNWLWSHKRWKHKRPAILQKEQLLEVLDREQKS